MEASKSGRKAPQIVQIRKKGGLNKIMTKQGIPIQPKMFHQEVKDPNSDGMPMGDYRGKTIVDTKYFISPHWSDLKKAWTWGGSAEELARTIDEMGLRYPEGHDKAGEKIKAGKNVADRLTHRKDPVFNHPELYGKQFMENGRVSLNLSNPVERFLYLCYKGNHETDDRNSEEPVSKYIASGTKYEIISPKAENQRKKGDATKEVKAVTLLAAMDGDEGRIRAICEIMDLPGYDTSTDITGAWLLLKDSAAQNPSMSSKYGKSYQSRFIELASLPDEDLTAYHTVITAKKLGKLRKRQGYWLSYDGSRIEGITNETQLINHFVNPENQDQYVGLLDAIADGRG